MAYAARVPPLRAALGCRCPRCGQGRLFSGFLRVAERCEVCGLELARQDSGDGPAAFLILIIGTVGVALAFWLEFSYDLPAWVPGVVAGVVAIGLTLLLIRPAKAYLIALQYRYRREDYGSG